MTELINGMNAYRYHAAMIIGLLDELSSNSELSGKEYYMLEDEITDYLKKNFSLKKSSLRA